MSGLRDEYVAALEAENDELRERVRQLEEELFFDPGWQCPLEFSLTPSEQQILQALMSREEASKDFLLLSTAEAGREKDAAIKIVDGHICHIRRKLKPFGVEIETLWGRGYRLPPASKTRLLNWTESEAA